MKGESGVVDEESGDSPKCSGLSPVGTFLHLMRNWRLRLAGYRDATAGGGATEIGGISWGDLGRLGRLGRLGEEWWKGRVQLLMRGFDRSRIHASWITLLTLPTAYHA